MTASSSPRRPLSQSSRFLPLPFLILGLILAAPAARAFPVQVGLSPDNSRDLLISTLNTARNTLIVNMYQLDSPEVVDALIDRMDQGVAVRILLEGSPVGGISDGGTAAIARLTSGMQHDCPKKCHFYLMHSDSPGDARRFRWDHAKYVVADSTRVLVTSENFTTTGHPTPGQVGNRGWEIALDKADLASTLSDLFKGDTDTSYGDVEDITKKRYPGKNDGADAHSKVRDIRPFDSETAEVENVTLFTSPKSLPGLQQTLDRAKSTLELEFMSLPSVWKESGDEAQNPIIDSLLAAAKRGVHVRVLLNDDSVFGGAPNEGDVKSDSGAKKHPNELTIELLNRLAQTRRLPLEARMIDIQPAEITYIHNKGIVVDDEVTLISSINGTENSVQNNRETALRVESPEVARYFRTAFDWDWSKNIKR